MKTEKTEMKTNMENMKTEMETVMNVLKEKNLLNMPVPPEKK